MFHLFVFLLPFLIAIENIDLAGEDVHARSEEQLNQQGCGFDEAEAAIAKSDPLYFERQREDRKQFRKYLEQEKANAGRSLPPIYTMPVVVHIVHDGAAYGTQANPSDESVAATIAEASSRFRHAHAGAGTYVNPHYGPDTEIELCLATLDPDGNYTTGVTRHFDPALAIGTYNATASGLNAFAWDKSKYVNLYIMTNMTNASGVYLSFYDFTIYTSGTFWSGLIAHELGHYFSLPHVFTPNENCDNTDCTMDGDGICDTPPKFLSGFAGNPCDAPGNSCSSDEDDTSNNNPYRPVVNGGMGDQPDMLANYMDYTGSCWDAFTLEQKSKMRSNIQTGRLSINAHAAIGCVPQATPSHEARMTSVSILQQDECTRSVSIDATVQNLGVQILNSLQLDVEINGNPVYSTSWTGSLANGNSAVVSISDAALSLEQGDNLIKVSISDPNGQTDANIYDNSGYATRTYLGGDFCFQVDRCQDLNGATNQGPGNQTVIRLYGEYPDLQAEFPDPIICVKIFGDVSSTSETFNILGEDGLSYGVTNIAPDCSGYTEESCFTIDMAKYGLWTADDTIKIALDPVTIFINPTLCVTNEACGRIIIPQKTGCPTDTVYVSANAGAGSLRDLVECTLSGDTIYLDGATIPDTIVLTSPLTINKDLFIIGVNGAGVVIKGDQTMPIFDVSVGVTVQLIDFQLVASSLSNHGRAIINAGFLQLENIHFGQTSEAVTSLIENTGELKIVGSVDLRDQ